MFRLAMVRPTLRSGSFLWATATIRGHHVLDPEHDVLEQLRAFRPAPLQRPLGLGVHLPEPGRHVVVLRVDEVLVLGVCDGRAMVSVSGFL